MKKAQGLLQNFGQVVREFRFILKAKMAVLYLQICILKSQHLGNKSPDRIGVLRNISFYVPFMAEMVGFEPTERVTVQTISSRSRYDHFDTSPTILLYHISPKKSSVFSKKRTAQIGCSFHNRFTLRMHHRNPVQRTSEASPMHPLH